MIFGKPFEYDGTKWVPSSGSSGQPAPDKHKFKISPASAHALLQKDGLEHVDLLGSDGLRAVMKYHNIDWKKMTPKERLDALVKIYGASGKGIADKPDVPKETPKAKIEPPVVKEYSNKNLHPASSADRVKQLIKDSSPQKGRHWGSAESTNETAVAVAYASGSTFRPIDNDVKEKSQMISDRAVQMGAGMRKYAQERMAQVPRDKHPEIYRGMTLPPEAFQALMEGKEKNIELTGCTAFTFHKDVMERYSASSWTQSFGKDKKGVKLVLTRDDHVDNSIGMWHDHKSDSKKPAFELLTGLECVTVTKIEGLPSDKKKDPKVLAEKYDKQAKQFEKRIDKFKQDNPEESVKYDVAQWASSLPGTAPKDSGEVIKMIVEAPKGKFDTVLRKLKEEVVAKEQRNVTSNTSPFDTDQMHKFIEHLEKNKESMTKLQENFDKLDKDIQSGFLATADRFAIRRTMNSMLRSERDGLEDKKRVRQGVVEGAKALGDTSGIRDYVDLTKHLKSKGLDLSYRSIDKLVKELGIGSGDSVPVIYVTAGRYKEDAK